MHHIIKYSQQTISCLFLLSSLYRGRNWDLRMLSNLWNYLVNVWARSCTWRPMYILPSRWSSPAPDLVSCPSHTIIHWFYVLGALIKSRHMVLGSGDAMMNGTDVVHASLGPTAKGHQIKCLKNDWLVEWMNELNVPPCTESDEV